MAAKHQLIVRPGFTIHYSPGNGARSFAHYSMTAVNQFLGRYVGIPAAGVGCAGNISSLAAQCNHRVRRYCRLLCLAKQEVHYELVKLKIVSKLTQ